MTVQCALCDHFTFKDSALAKFGFGLCKGIKRDYVSCPSATFKRDCATYVTATGDKLTQRMNWLNKGNSSAN